MASPEALIGQPAVEEIRAFAPFGARRLLVLAGLGMILLGMTFGDIFAVFVLHQNAARVGASLTAAADAALRGDSQSVASSFANVGQFLENRGTKVDTHVHLIGFGYLGLMLAIIQPWVLLSDATKKSLAWSFVHGGVVLPVGVFLIHYIGLAFSPFNSIGWASIVADAGGFLVMLATGGYLLGIARGWSWKKKDTIADPLLAQRSGVGRALFSGGVILVSLGCVHGAWYASTDLYRHEAADYNILSEMASGAADHDAARVNQSLKQYGQMQGEKAVNIAAHAHLAEFGILVMLIAFFQPYVSLREIWKRRWAGVLLAGSALLPICVLLELRFGLLAGGLADFGGLLVIVAGFAMWVGILRYTGSLDSQSGVLL